MNDETTMKKKKWNNREIWNWSFYTYRYPNNHLSLLQSYCFENLSMTSSFMPLPYQYLPTNLRKGFICIMTWNSLFDDVVAHLYFLKISDGYVTKRGWDGWCRVWLDWVRWGYLNFQHAFHQYITQNPRTKTSQIHHIIPSIPLYIHDKIIFLHTPLHFPSLHFTWSHHTYILYINCNYRFEGPLIAMDSENPNRILLAARNNYLSWSYVANSYIGSWISLTSNSEIRCEGFLYRFNPEDSIVVLSNGILLLLPICFDSRNFL